MKPEPLSYHISMLALKINTFLKWLELYKLWTRMLDTEHNEMINKAEEIVARPL
jgi:hypothetical protein